MSTFNLSMTVTAFFKSCRGQLGDIPQQFKIYDFWASPTNAELLKSHEDTLRRWHVLSLLPQLLVSEAVEGDLDTYADEKPNMPLEQQAVYALGRVSHYMGQKELGLICNQHAMNDMAAVRIHKSTDLFKTNARRYLKQSHGRVVRGNSLPRKPRLGRTSSVRSITVSKNLSDKLES